MLTALWASCSWSVAGAGELTVKEIPGIDARAQDSIDGLDFTIVDGQLHAVWLESVASPAQNESRFQIWHRQLNLSNEHWGIPSSLPQRARGPLRVAAVEGRLQVFVGPHLQHFQLSASNTWESLPDALPSASAIALGIATDGPNAILFYLTRIRSGGNPGVEDSVEVWTATSGRGGIRSRIRLAKFPGGPTQPEPKLLIVHGTYHLFAAINRVAKASNDDLLSEDSRIVYIYSRDKGKTWSSPQVLGVLGIQGHHARPEGSGYVSHLDAVYLNKQFLVLYNASWLYMLASPDAQRWSDPSVLVGARTWVGAARNSSVAIASEGDRGAVFWVDERYQRTDASPLNPLGLHWLADPDWENNDVLTIPLSVLRDRALAKKPNPVRLTRDLSYAERIRALALHGRCYALWTGRGKVGRELDSYGKPPTIFLISMPAK